MVVAFDLDGTLCSECSDYADAEPIKKMIDVVNEVYDKGGTVYIFTGRHMMSEQVTRRWLDNNGVKRHCVFYGKPVADIYVDDRAVSYDGNHNSVRNIINEKSGS